MRRSANRLGAAALALGLAWLATGPLGSIPAGASEVESLREQLDAQSELIRAQAEALEEMGDRVRALEDERAAHLQAPAPVSIASDGAGAPQPHRPGAGFRITEADWGALRLRLYTYVRYLNQLALDHSYKDSFGVESNVDRRQDVHLQKVNLQFNGWVMSPKLRYLLYVWTANTSQGLGAQVVVGGNLQYDVAEYLTLGGGIGSLPGVRSTSGNFPFWLGVDNRLIADEFFRPSYTMGFWASGSIVDGLEYQLMLGNNLSQLGIDAGQLDGRLETVSASLAWMPTTGEFGGGGFGDYEEHEEIATRLALHFTYSPEDQQSQPSTESPDNSQIRISDGNVIFEPDLFGPGIDVRKAVYHMLAFDAGVKYDGFALEGELYYRWVTGFRGPGTGLLDFDTLHDLGFQLQASAMLLPQTLQVYASGSQVFGEYGDPWDVRLGVNWYPFANRSFRWNNELIWLHESPVGALSLPYVVGGEGLVFYSNLELNF